MATETNSRTRTVAHPRLAEEGDRFLVGPADGRQNDVKREDDQHGVGRAGEPLAPEVIGAAVGGAEIADAAEGRAHLAYLTHAMTSHRRIVSAIDPAKLATARMSRAGLPMPKPKSQTKWRRPPRRWWISAHE